MSAIKQITLLCVISLGLSCRLNAAEYFVNKQGDDASNGTSRGAAFLTIQKGVDALEPGDTLTVGPGEYFENVKPVDFADLENETPIRAGDR